MAHAGIVLGVLAPRSASKPDAARGRLSAWQQQPRHRPIACPARVRDAVLSGSDRDSLHPQPMLSLIAGSVRLATSSARRSTAGVARGPGTVMAPIPAVEQDSAPTPAVLGTEQLAEATARRRAAAPQLVSTSRRRMLSQVGMVGLVAGLCICCPGLASADEWSYGKRRTSMYQLPCPASFLVQSSFTLHNPNLETCTPPIVPIIQ